MDTISGERVAEDNSQEIALARRAASGESQARAKVATLVHPIITHQSERFCKRFCQENRHIYKCTLPSPWGNPPSDALLCEWGNACYAWMMEDLVSANRLQRFEGRDGARLFDYLCSIANSLPFYERWKNWRFGRRIYIPAYIKELSEKAPAVFLGLRAGHGIALIAQQLVISEAEAEQLAQDIIVRLTERGRLYLLAPEQTVSLSHHGGEFSSVREDDSTQLDIACQDPDEVFVDLVTRLKQAWKQLSPVEQFILESMLIEEQDANDVLVALQKLNINLNEKIAAENTDRQQLYYFKRKTLVKLARLSGIE